MNNSLSSNDLQEHRQKFPGLVNKTYFNFGGQGTMPDAALNAIIDTHKYIQQVGPFSGQINSWLTDKINALREAIATELNTTAQTITITENVTAGCNIALWGVDWQNGDRILMSDCEHPGIIATVEEITRRFGVEVTICPIMDSLNDSDPVEIIRAHLTENTRLVVLSHLLWNTGQVLPLKEIAQTCHNYPAKHTVRLMVDAAQSVGSLDLNLPELEVDYYAFTGHKWLCGPAGVGGLYISKEAFGHLNPTFIGWRGVKMDGKGKPIAWKQDGTKYEVATSAYPEYEGLRNAIALHQSWGTSKQRYQRICEISKYLWAQLQTINRLSCLKNTPPEAGLISFTVADIEHAKMVDDLEKQGFLLRTIADPDCIRACVHYLTLKEECDRLVSAIDKQLLTDN
ncbi:aminotransferase class V-fold PLP-dependent enzyme [Waterburya agarophytonicola K14]|uniref:Aminotransferase class V-fold PLP-dependent enzyme n=1 Tax=Waterburya agarophytonicola KI4 TaxID=2874699 RepID=A0A964BUN7_9CYAN|nr:aminotransferase class V-fold PLP-dependent enzyme [Waterburya agarophytonicola]MCC0178205.1 aminotransferase class V-fold PLP-dependent enzyme [Waterburya agarophytonicola KI4]